MRRQTTVSVAVTPEFRDEVAALLKNDHGIAVSEFLRLCLVYVRDTGKLPMDVPREKRGRKTHQGGMMDDMKSRTFFE